MKVKRSLLGMLALGMILCGCFDTPNEEHVSDATMATPPDPDAHYAYTQEELFVERGENQIYGILYLPQDVQGPLPAVIYAHGYGGTHQNGTAYAQALAEKGYAVYCFDFCGGSPDSQSDGSTLDMSIFTEQEDLMAVIDAIGSREDIDPSPLYLLGSSQGGVVSAITAARQSDRIAGMILPYPAFILCEEANSLFADAAAIPDSYYFLWMEVGRAYFEPLIGYDVYEDIGNYTKDVWILHGDADTIVPLSSSKRTQDIYDHAELLVLPGSGHGFYGDAQQEAIDAILGYLRDSYD